MYRPTNERLHRALPQMGFGPRVFIAAAVVGVLALACDVPWLSAPGDGPGAGVGEAVGAALLGRPASRDAAFTPDDALRPVAAVMPAGGADTDPARAGFGAPHSPLRSAAAFGILAGAGVSCAISGTVSGTSGPANIGSTPTSTVTGFAPCTFSGSIPLPAVVAVAQGDLTAAYLAAQGLECNTGLTGFDLGFYDGSATNKTLPPGTYCFATAAALTGTLRLIGAATARWTFQVGTTLSVERGAHVVMAGGATADNVYWVVGRSATLMNDALYLRLAAWVEKHYRDQLGEADLGDPVLLDESRAALDELTQILALGSVYPFQLGGD